MDKKEISLGIVAVSILFGAAIYSQTTDQLISRLGIVYPAYDEPGGRPLYEKMQRAWEKVGDNINSRYVEYTGIEANQAVSINHGLGVSLDEISVLLYSGTGSEKVRIASPSQAGWRIDPSDNNEAQEVKVTTPATGGPFDFSVVLINDGGVLRRDFSMNRPRASFIGAIGSPDDPNAVIGGRTLTDSELSTRFESWVFWNFNETLDTSGDKNFCTTSCNLTLKNSDTTATYVNGIQGQNGISLENSALTIAHPLFNSESSFSVSFWFNPSDFDGSYTYFGTADDLFTTGYRVRIYQDRIAFVFKGVFKDSIIIVNEDILTNITDRWNHFVLSFDTNGFIKIYINNVLVIDHLLEDFLSVSDSNSFTLLGKANDGNKVPVLLDEFLFVNGIISSEDVKDMTSYTFQHNADIPVTNQLWHLKLYNDIFNINRIDYNRRTPNSIKWNILDLSPETSLTAIMYTNEVSVDSFDVVTYDSQILISVPSTLAHGLHVIPSKVTIQYEVERNRWQEIDSSLCAFDNINLYCDFSSFSVGEDHRVRILASRSPIAFGVAEAGKNQKGIVTNQAQVLGGDKTLKISHPVGDIIRLFGGLTISGLTDSIIRLDPNGSDRSVTLANAGWTKGRSIHVCNVGTANQVNIKAFDQSDILPVLPSSCLELVATSSTPLSSFDWLSL